jgi:DNA mismatch endonuclease (patch repair protein)
MKAVRRQGTKAELALRAALDALGVKYAVNGQPLPTLQRKADILFRSEKVAVFVDGCFWHGCPIHGTQAKANAEFWREKIERNQQRDSDTNQHLQEAGWLVVRVWAHEEPDVAAKRIKETLHTTQAP